MTAVDTNVVIRLLTADDPKQAAAATSLFAAGPIWIAKTVLLETGWVLQSGYRRPTACGAWIPWITFSSALHRDAVSGVDPARFGPRPVL